MVDCLGGRRREAEDDVGVDPAPCFYWRSVASSQQAAELVQVRVEAGELAGDVADPGACGAAAAPSVVEVYFGAAGRPAE